MDIDEMMKDERAIFSAQLTMELTELVRKHCEKQPPQIVVLVFINHALMMACEHGYTEDDLRYLLRELRQYTKRIVEDASSEGLQTIVDVFKANATPEQVKKIEALTHEQLQEKLGEVFDNVFEPKDKPKIQ